MCDDDEDDKMLIADALQEARLTNCIDFSSNGEELLSYLRREGKYEKYIDEPLPGLILLDLNMPIMDGRTVLAEIKKDKLLKSIPIVVLTTSKAEIDIAVTYNMGVNSFIVKPVTFQSLVSVVHSITDYWFNIVQLPDDKS